MKINELYQILESNEAKKFMIDFGAKQVIPEGYHLTEVKNIISDSVDCGGAAHQEKQVVIQFWINSSSEEKGYLSAGKIREILALVDRKRETFRDAEVLFEYGDASMPTSLFQTDRVEATEEAIWFHTSVPATACRPLLELTQSDISCGKGSNCC